MSEPVMKYEKVLEWFDKAIASCKSSGRLDSALLWTDGKEHLEFMKQQRDELLAALKAIVDNDSYDTEYDGRMHSICYSCGVQDSGPHLEMCDYKIAHVAIAKVEESK